MKSDMENLLIYRQGYRSQDLVANYPAKLNHKHKNLVYQISCPEGSIHSGDIIVSRWRAISLESMSSKIVNRSKIEMRSGYFRYDSIDWYSIPDKIIAIEILFKQQNYSIEYFFRLMEIDRSPI